MGPPNRLDQRNMTLRGLCQLLKCDRDLGFPVERVGAQNQIGGKIAWRNAPGHLEKLP